MSTEMFIEVFLAVLKRRKFQEILHLYMRPGSLCYVHAANDRYILSMSVAPLITVLAAGVCTKKPLGSCFCFVYTRHSGQPHACNRSYRRCRVSMENNCSNICSNNTDKIIPSGTGDTKHWQLLLARFRPFGTLSFASSVALVFIARRHAIARYMPSTYVCLSQVGVLLKWLNTESRKQRHMIA